MISDLAANLPTKITAPATGGGTPGNAAKRFRISVAKAGLGPRYKRSNATYEISYEQMSRTIQNIHKMGGKILSITQIA